MQCCFAYGLSALRACFISASGSIEGLVGLGEERPEAKPRSTVVEGIGGPHKG